MRIEKQFNYNANSEDNSLIVSADYDGDTLSEVTIEVVDYINGETINLTNVLGIYCPDAMDSIINQVNWHELYREKKLGLEN